MMANKPRKKIKTSNGSRVRKKNVPLKGDRHSYRKPNRRMRSKELHGWELQLSKAATQWQADIDKADRIRSQANQDLADTVKKALRDGMALTKISEITGMKRQWLYQIIEK